MTTENIDIRVREDGSVVVRRNLEAIGPAASGSANAVDFLKRALAGLGAGLAVREVIKLVDTFVNLENRLRSTGLEGQQLTAVYKALLDASNETRSSVAGSIELYSRLAVSTKELGVSQQQLIDFTKSLNQAIILSGASAQEAQAGIIQLSQGIASGTLRGDELRSVLEQLPAVADVIAKSLGVTRGELRRLGEEGKITANTVLKAFAEARTELNDRFGKTVPTLSQAFMVLKNQTLDYVGQLDKATGFSTAFSKALLGLAENLDVVIKALTGLLAGLILVGGTQALIAGLAGAFRLLTAAVAANPLGAFLVVLTSVVTTIVLFSDKMQLGIDSVTTLSDWLQALGEVAGRVFSAIGDWINDTFGGTVAILKGWFEQWDISWIGAIKTVAGLVDMFIGLWRGAINATIVLFKSLPAVLSDLFTQALNHVLERIGAFVNMAGKLLSTVTEFVGLGSIATNLDFTLDNASAGAAARLGEDVGLAFNRGLIESNPAQGFVDELTARAKELSSDRVRKAMFDKPTIPDNTAGKARALPVNEKEITRATNALRSLLNMILPSEAAVLELAKAQHTLNEAQRLGIITGEQSARYYALAQKFYEDTINPLGAINRNIDEQNALLKVSNRERGVEAVLLQHTQDMQRQGKPLTDSETEALRAKLQAQRDLNEATQIQDQLLANSVEARRSALVQMQQISALLANPSSGFTKGDAAQATMNMAPGLLEGTQTALDAQAQAFADMYAQIDSMRQLDLISAETAAQAKQKIAISETEFGLQNATDFFGSLAQLQSSGNKKLAAIGKAAAVTQATIDGILAVQKALASAPPPYNYALAAAVGISAAANVAKIAGFAEGGYTGDMGTGKVAGVVHGQEYVVNADATARNRATLEAMNAGRDVGMGGINVEIHNMGTPQTYDVQQIDERTVRLIARDEVAKGSPTVVATSIADANSAVSKSLKQHTTAERRR